MDKAVVTGILVTNSDGKLLLVKKPDGIGPYAGMYLTPGGGVKNGERVVDAAERELYEETGVKVKNIKPLVFDDDFTEDWSGVKKHFIMLLYTGDYLSGDLKPTEGDDDHLEVIRWVGREELSNLSLCPPLMKILKLTGHLS